MLTEVDIDILLSAIDVTRKFSRMFGEVSIFDEKSHIEDVLLGLKNGKYEIVERKEK